MKKFCSLALLIFLFVDELSPTLGKFHGNNNNNRQLGGIFGVNGEPCITTKGQYGICQSAKNQCGTIDKSELEICPSYWGTYVCCPNEPENGGISGSLQPPAKPKIECGKSPFLKQHYIVNGTEAFEKAFPFLAALFETDFKGKQHYICGGSVVHEQFILTAAHCVERGPQAGKFTVKLGAHRLSTTGTNHNIAEVIIHKNYNPNKHQFDIALLRLAQPLNWDQDSSVRPICLPSDEMGRENFNNQMALVAGWGTVSPNAPKHSEVLYFVEVPIMPTDECARYYSSLLDRDDKVNERHICAGYRQGGKDSCQGDSGGPLFMAINGSFYQLGLVSFGKGCAEPKYPGVYTRLTKYLSWLGTYIRD